MKPYDVFVSHASEDKQAVARPIAALLIQAGLKVWIDEAELTLGDSLRRSIDRGLSNSRYGVVVLSQAFFRKEWPKKELDALVAREDGLQKVILPIWHEVTTADISKYSPLLADRLATSTSKGLRTVVSEILRAIEAGRDSAPDTDQAPGTAVSDATDTRLPLSEGPIQVTQYLARFLDQIVEAADAGTPVTGVETGFRDFDQLTGGLLRGEIYVLASRPSMGSTTFALNVARHISCKQGIPVVYFSSQDRGTELLTRLIAASGRIDRQHLAAAMLAEDEWARLVEAADLVKGAPLYIDDSPNLTAAEVINRARIRATDVGTLGLLVVDGLQGLGKNDRELSDALHELRSFARELGIPVLLLSHVSRSVEARQDKRPTLTDMGASELEQVAAGVFFLYRDEYYNPDSPNPGVVELIVAHRRGGVRGTVRLVFMRPLALMEDLLMDSRA